jgi:hypothetical protein
MRKVKKRDKMWTLFRMFGTMMHAKSFAEIIPRQRGVSRKHGYITPPLHYPMTTVTTLSWRRMGVVVLFVMILLYLCGFTIPGLSTRNTKVVIILAANLGGGTRYLSSDMVDDRCLGCQEFG